MATELLDEGTRPELVEGIGRDIEELDDLIGELLIASRLEAPDVRLEFERVDLLALAAEEAAGMVGVEVFASREDAATPGQPRVTLTVSDAGQGIAESEREHIFERFYRPPNTASAEGGIGLGLALVRQIAERHRGGIHCEARAETNLGDDDDIPRVGGTRFVLDLPAAQN